MCLSMAISSCCKFVGLGLIGDLAIYQISPKLQTLVHFKRITNTHGGKPITDLFFFNEDNKQAIFSISYGYDYKVIHLEAHVHNETYPLDRSVDGEEQSKQQRAANIQVACLTNRKFYFIQNNDLKLESP